jgi:hypothetical protein
MGERITGAGGMAAATGPCLDEKFCMSLSIGVFFLADSGQPAHTHRPEQTITIFRRFICIE